MYQNVLISVIDAAPYMIIKAASSLEELYPNMIHIFRLDQNFNRIVGKKSREIYIPLYMTFSPVERKFS